MFTSGQLFEHLYQIDRWEGSQRLKKSSLQEFGENCIEGGILFELRFTSLMCNVSDHAMSPNPTVYLKSNKAELNM